MLAQCCTRIGLMVPKPTCILVQGDNVFMVTELMECDLHAALGQDALLEPLSWRKKGMQIALDIAMGLSCALPWSAACH